MNKNMQLSGRHAFALGIAVFAIALAGCGEQKQNTETPANRGIGGPVVTNPAGATQSGGKQGGTKSGSYAPGATAPQSQAIDGLGTADASRGKLQNLKPGLLKIIQVVQRRKVKIKVVSPQDDVLVINGYNLNVPLKANKPKTYVFKANKPGIFVLNFKKQGTEVAELRVSPR